MRRISALTLLLLAAAGTLASCTTTEPLTEIRTHAWDTDDPNGGVPMMTLEEAADRLGLTIRTTEDRSERYLSSGRNQNFHLFLFEPNEYSYNYELRKVEYPGIQHEGSLITIPLGMYNEMAADIGRFDLQIRKQFDPGDRPYTDRVKLSVPAEKDTSNNTSDDMPRSSALKGLTITIDAGHGGKDPGAVAVDGAQEKVVALNVALGVQRYLQAMGATILMTRSDNETYVSLDRRVERANNAGSDLFVSIHANAAATASANGVETYYAITGGRETVSKALAQNVNDAMVRATGSRDRGAKPNARSFRVLKNTKMPAVLVETGFISNADERSRLIRTDYQATLAKAIVTGVLKSLARGAVVQR